MSWWKDLLTLIGRAAVDVAQEKLAKPSGTPKKKAKPT